jgi:hypothetical protein
MANKLAGINQLRPRILSQEVVGLEKISKRIARNTTYNVEEIYGMLRLFSQETNAALQAGETVKIDGLLVLTPNMKIGGGVDLSIRGDRGAIANLNNPQLWMAGKVSNHEHLSKTSEQLIAFWNEHHPDDPVVVEPQEAEPA